MVTFSPLRDALKPIAGEILGLRILNRWQRLAGLDRLGKWWWWWRRRFLDRFGGWRLSGRLGTMSRRHISLLGGLLDASRSSGRQLALPLHRGADGSARILARAFRQDLGEWGGSVADATRRQQSDGEPKHVRSWYRQCHALRERGWRVRSEAGDQQQQQQGGFAVLMVGKSEEVRARGCRCSCRRWMVRQRMCNYGRDEEEERMRQLVIEKRCSGEARDWSCRRRSKV